MDLVNLAKDLLSKAESFTKQSNVTNSESFQLREELRSDVRAIAILIDGPDQTLKNVARGFTVCSALKICVDMNLAHQLPESEARSAEQLAESCGCDKRLLRPVLRLLEQNGIFHQNVDESWRHTETSKLMNRAGFHAWMTSILEEKYRSVAHLPRLLQETGHQFPTPGNTAFNAVYRTPLDFYTYSALYDHGPALNFALSMEELARNQLEFLSNSYPLDRLDSGCHFVDVAGGFGNLCYHLASKLPRSSFEVQDHPFIVERARESCPADFKGRIHFKAHDMLLAQPCTDRPNSIQYVFLLKIILHDHGDEDCKLILQHLLSSMRPGDIILIFDTVIPEVGGSLSSCHSDLIILSMFGCGHRTLQEFLSLIRGCGEDLIIETFTGGLEESDGMMSIEIRKP